MLRTNSKKARENIRAYIINHFDGTNYDLPETNDFSEIANYIYNTFKSEKYYSDNYMMKNRISEQTSFTDWCSGLPSILDTCYYYNRSAVDDLGAILEESENEKARYTEEKAENLLTYLIYREIKGGLSKWKNIL